MDRVRRGPGPHLWPGPQGPVPALQVRTHAVGLIGGGTWHWQRSLVGALTVAPDSDEHETVW